MKFRNGQYVEVLCKKGNNFDGYGLVDWVSANINSPRKNLVARVLNNFHREADNYMPYEPNTYIVLDYIMDSYIVENKATSSIYIVKESNLKPCSYEVKW